MLERIAGSDLKMQGMLASLRKAEWARVDRTIAGYSDIDPNLAAAIKRKAEEILHRRVDES